MASNQRFEISASSPDNVAFGYSNSHRAHFASGTNGPSLEKSSSFRESNDGSGRAVAPGFAGPPSVNSHGELPPMSQLLSLEVISSGEQKYARQLELRRATVAAMALIGEVMGNSQQKPLEQQGMEEIKRIRSSLIENANRARERARLLSDAIMKLEKFRSTLQSRKRARGEALGHERSMTSGPGERSITAGSASANKATFCASPNHPSITEGNVSKLDDKNKGGVPNKRMRTSMQDVRLESRTSTPTFQRSAGMGDRERESLKPGSSFGGVPDEKDRLVQGNGENWERTKTKGKRSATKADSSTATGGAGTSEVERDHKWSAQQRTNADNRPRPSEGHSFRSGPVHGVVSIHKSAMRNEPDSAVAVGDKGDRFLFQEKDRTMLKSGAKLLHKDEGSLLNSNVSKAKAARGPRTGAGIPIASSGAHTARPPHSTEVWDRTAVATAAATVAANATPGRAQIPVGLSNRKRPAPTRSSSPPVAQWVGQRSQTISRIARRTNVAPPVGPAAIGRDEGINTAETEAARDSMVTPTGVRSNPSMAPPAGLLRKVTSTAALSQMKSKTERISSPVGLSESEESEGGDVKGKDKWKKQTDPEARFAAINKKTAPLFSPGKKSRVGPKEDGGDGIRRQGRSSRPLIPIRESSAIPHIEKGDISANAKQLRSARPGTEKPEKPVEVKPGRPPTKKGGVGDRKSLTRPRRPAINGVDVLGESDDDHEEIVAAVQAAVNASVHACSSVFWKEMEPFFVYLTHDARENLRRQVRIRASEEEEIFPGLFATDEKNVTFYDCSGASNVSNGLEVNGGMTFNDSKEKKIGEVGNGGWLSSRQLPLSQRLLAALIIEEDIDDDSREDNQFDLRDGFSHDPSDSEQAGVDKEQDSESEVETRRGDSGRLNGWSRKSPYDSSYTSNGHRHWDSESELLNSPAKSEARKEDEKNTVDFNGSNKLDGAYQNMKLDDRIALELQSIGLYPDPADLMPREDDDIAEELKKSFMELKEQAHINKERLFSLEQVVSSLQEDEERERERLAMRKLLENTFIKRLGNRGGPLGVSGSKSAASKAGRVAALAVAKRSLVRWKHYAETGESCIKEPGLREVLFCISTKDRESKALATNADIYAGTRWICHTPGMQKVEKDVYEPVAGTPSERSGDKDDIWCSRSKEREVLLEDVVGGSIPCATKGKRSERDAGTNIKGNGRQGLGGAIKGERKTKTKPRQKTAPLLKAVNGLLGKPNEPSEKLAVRIKADASSLGLGIEAQTEGDASLDLTHLQIPGMDDLVVNGDLEGQGQDLGSWLDFDDPGLPDAGGDFMGLDVPMDDLADLAMMM